MNTRSALNTGSADTGTETGRDSRRNSPDTFTPDGGTRTQAGTRPSDTADPSSSGSPANPLTGLGEMLKDRLRETKGYLLEMSEYAGHMVRVRIDRVLLGLRTVLIDLSLIALFIIGGIAAFLCATVFLMQGISGGLGELFGRPWLGSLVTGILFIGLSLVAIMVAINRLVAKSRVVLHAKYEARKAAQRERFGRDVTGAAAGEHAP